MVLDIMTIASMVEFQNVALVTEPVKKENLNNLIPKNVVN